MTIARAQMNRQLYQMGGMGIESLSPMQPAMQPAMQSAMYNPLENNYYSGMPMMMAGGGIANLVKREKYGLGSALKSVARTFIPKELDSVLKIAAPFLGPVYGPIASIAGSARSGKIDPFSLAAATLPYVQFGGGSGLSSLIPTGYGGSGMLGQYLPGGSLQIGSGTSLSQMIGDKAREFLSPNTPTQNLLKTPTTGYTGGVDLAPSELTGRTAQELQSTLVSGGGLSPDQAARSAQDLIKTYGVQPGTQPGYIDLIKKAGSLENVSLSERFNAVKDLSTKALTDLYTKPIPGEPGKTQLDKTALYATFAGASSYFEARKLADKAGIPESEFSEEDYQRLKVEPEKKKYTEVLKPESFGIRPQKAGGGMMDEGVLSIKLTPAMAMGGIISERDNKAFGGISGLLKKISSSISDIVKPDSSNVSSQPNTILESPVNALYKYYLDSGTDEEYKKRIMESINPRFGINMAKGGKINYPMGNEIPVRQNQGGVSELDLRAKGGYIPVGIKEKADDVPAMLSKNEFVFTADAVRGAGNGNINKGAQKMYKLMKSLEKKVKKMKKVA